MQLSDEFSRFVSLNVTPWSALSAACAVVLGYLVGANLLVPQLLIVVLLSPVILKPPLLLALAFGGSVVLGYGFANLGLSVGGTPIPLAEILLVILGACMLLIDRPLLAKSLQRFPWILILLLWASIRFVFDYPVWGEAALRDATFFLELLFVVVGYWAMAHWGPNAIVRIFSWSFVVATGYFMLYPWRESLREISPTVGLQRPESLLGNDAGVGLAACGAILFFLVVRPHKMMVLCAAVLVPVIFLVQSRGVYLALILSLVVLAISRPKHSSGGVLRRLGVVVAVASFGLILLLPLGLQGRVGTASVGFFGDQLETLLGSAGPGAGTIDDRQRWTQSTLAAVSEQQAGWLVGVGLGPDLIEGFDLAGGVSVRKPHNDYLEIFARTGLVGLFALVLLFIPLFRALLRSSRRGHTGPLVRWVLAMCVAYFFVAATQPTFWFPYGTIPVFVPLGAALALIDEIDGRYGP